MPEIRKVERGAARASQLEESFIFVSRTMHGKGKSEI
jgi:hypothetical protein